MPTSLLHDLRYALRTLRRRPGFTAAVVATIALGVGANVAVFGVVQAALLRPLSFAEPARLVHLWTTRTDRPDARSEASYPDFLDLRQRATAFAGIAGYHTARVTLDGGDGGVVLPAAKVTSDFFDVLGVPPAIGRRFAPGEDAIGGPMVAMITHALWRRAFDGDPAVVGRTVQLDGVPHTIVGVLPERFRFAGAAGAEVWLPIDRPAPMRERRSTHWLRAVARLRDGVTIDGAGRALAGVMQELAREHPASNDDKSMTLVPLRDELVGRVRPLLLVLYGAVGFVLLVACGNVANLLLMRGAARERELAVRAAIGAGRARIARQLLAESTVLALAGGALGVPVAWLAMRALVAAIPPEQARALPYLHEIGLDASLVAYAFGVSILAAALAGVVPALRAARIALAPTLRQGAGGTPAASQRTLRDGLVVAQLALTIVLVSGAALFAGSLARLLAIEPGFRADGVLTAGVPLPRLAYVGDAVKRRFYERLEARVAALPGVAGVGFVSKLPLDAGNTTSIGLPGGPGDERVGTSFRVASADYFRTLGIPLLAGRTFVPGEDTTVMRAAIVDRALARALFGDADPVGRELQLGSDGELARIVGVVGEVTTGRLEEAGMPTIYYSMRQSMDGSMRMVVRTSGDPHALAPAIRRVVRELDPGVGLWQVYTMEELVGQSQSVFLRRYPLLLVGAFGALALVLALVGTYGVVSFAVAQRRRELGIRVALGARPAAIRWLVLRHAGTLALAGAGAGMVAAVALARVARGLTWGVERTEPAILALVAVLLAAMAIAAAAIPARRATRTDPVDVLRGD